MPIGQWMRSPRAGKLGVLTLALALTVIPACKKGSTVAAPTTDGTKASTASASTNTDAQASVEQAADAKGALELLVKGNDRYVTGNFVQRDLSKAKLEELAKGQHPFATVLTCSDSRVAPELLFDQSIGGIFVVRVAGNVLDKASMGSIEYAAEHLHTPLIFVLGHEKCGAVTAATTGDGAEGSIQYLVNEIKPAVTKAKALGGDLVAKSIDENVRHVIDTLPGRSKILKELVEQGKVKLAGGTYSITDGKVSILVDVTSGGETKEESASLAH